MNPKSKMVTNANHDQLPQKSLQIKQDDKFFSRLLSKESSKVNSSSRVYYGRAPVAIPFMWESQPGTPKHPSSDISLPPLTPPPSYYSSPKSKSKQNRMKPNIFIRTIFPNSTPKNTHVSPSYSLSSASLSSSSSSSSSGSSSYSSPSTSNKRKLERPRHDFSCSRLPLHYGIEDDHEQELGSSTSSMMCSGVKHKIMNGIRGCYPMANMKNALLSIVRHGSGQGTA